MYKSVLSKLVTGEKLQTIIRIKPNDRGHIEDIKVLGQAISLFDTNNRMIETFEFEEVYTPSDPIQKLFDNSLSQYLTAFMQGFSLSVFSFGAAEAGKTQTIEGNTKEPGLILMFGDSLFNVMENKKHHTNNAQGQINSFSYNVRVRYVEVVDEEIKDLTPGSHQSEGLAVVNNEWEGPTILGAQWTSIRNAVELKEFLVKGQKNRTNASNEFGKLSHKATSYFTVELIQNTELSNRKESIFMVSRLNFLDLPAVDPLLDAAETLKVREGVTLNKSIVGLSTLIKGLAGNRGEYVFYDGSILTQLCRDILGGNSLTVGIFNVAYGDYKKTSATLTHMNLAKNIMNYPIINDGKTIGLLKKFRSEIIQLLNSGGHGSNSDDYNMKIADLEKRLIEDNLDKLKGADERQKMGSKLSELREKYNQLVKSKADLQAELIRSEEEKLEISKALVELQIENTRLLEVLQNEKYDANNRLLNAENDLIGAGIKEEGAFKAISDLQDRLKEISEEKRELEIELVALRKNYLTLRNDFENEKLKNENLGLEVINLVNENKALQNELNDTFKRANLGNEEGERYLNRLSRLERENQEKTTALIEAKAELERIKTEMGKYDLLEQRHRLDMDTKKLEVERGFMDLTKDKNGEMNRMSLDNEAARRRVYDDKLLWESEKIELSHKNKLLGRQHLELEERFKELSRTNEEMSAENSKMTIQIDEMRSVFRQKLLQFMGDQVKGDKMPGRIGYDLNAREELIRTYTEKEIDLKEKLDHNKTVLKQLKMENKALKNYARSLKYLAEDWAPMGANLPEILTRPPPVRLDEDVPLGNRAAEEEILRLRGRNRQLEEQVRMAQNQIVSTVDMFGHNGKGDEKAMQSKFYNEMQMLKAENTNQRLQSRGGGQNNDMVRRERNDLQEENRKLINLLKDNKKWDIYLLQKENEKLSKQVRDMESSDSVGPVSGESSNLKQKIMYYEKNMKGFEKERTELMVRATMAEEQLKNLQEHLRTTTQEYSKKIYELKKKLGQ